MTTNLLKPFIDKPLIKVISSIRRSGKAVILKLLKEELIEKGIEERQIIYLNLESLEFSDIEIIAGGVTSPSTQNSRYYALHYRNEFQRGKSFYSPTGIFHSTFWFQSGG